MGSLRGKVKKLSAGKDFGWIEYKPENSEDGEDGEEIYFFWGKRTDPVPEEGTEVTFVPKPDLTKPEEESYIATDIMPTMKK